MGERNGHSQMVVIDVDDPLFTSMNHKLSAFYSQGQEDDEYCTIYRVLPTVRNEDSGSFDPKIISIGPFHRDKEHLKPMEQLKWRFLHDLIHRSPDNSLHKYIKIARTLVPRARRCYSEPIDSGSIDAFAETMVLAQDHSRTDGAGRMLHRRVPHQIHRRRWAQGPPLLRQLDPPAPPERPPPPREPDPVLRPPFALRRLCCSRARHNHRGRRQPRHSPGARAQLCHLREDDRHPIPRTVHHLLHLFHSSLSPPQLLKSQSAQSPESNVDWIGHRVINKAKDNASHFSLWLMSLLFYCRRLPEAEHGPRAPRRIPSATELQEAGVKFYKKRSSRGLLDVSFRDGNMELPLLSVQAATIPQFRNLVAFEQCCPAAGSHFTSYVALMDNLIDTPEDVVLLERCGVIESKLGGSEEVAAFFNSLGKGGYLDYDCHYLAGVFKEVREFSAAESHRWRAMLMRDYFSSPWAIISFVAAVVLLGLTAVQTFFAVFAYFRPP